MGLAIYLIGVVMAFYMMYKVNQDSSATYFHTPLGGALFVVLGSWVVVLVMAIPLLGINLSFRKLKDKFGGR